MFRKTALFILIITVLAFAGCNNSNTTQNASTDKFEDATSLSETSSLNLNSLPEWKRLYINTLEDVKDKYCNFALVYIDSDDIPELY